MARTSHILSACIGALLCAAILQPADTPTLPGNERQALTAPASAPTAPINEPLLSAPSMPQRDARPLNDQFLPVPRSELAFTPEMAQNCIDVARMIDPDMAKRLEQLRSENMANFQVMLATRGERLLSLAELRARDPKLFSLRMLAMQTDAQVMQVARDLRKAVERADSPAMAAFESELEVLLTMQFALTIGARGEYILELEDHVARLKQEIADMVELKDTLISERLDQLKCGDAPVQPSWQRNSSSYVFAARMNPTIAFEAGSSNDDDDPAPDE